jgi:hypothetical protein
VANDAEYSGSRQHWRAQVSRCRRRQDDGQGRRNTMQHSREIEGGRGPGLVTYQCGIEPRSRRIAGFGSLSRRHEAYRLITERRQDFLMPQQTLAIRLKYQNRFANASHSYARGILNRHRLL